MKITYIGDTDQHNFPLIMIFGRESNNSGNGDFDLGKISIKRLSSGRGRGGFWPNSYNFIDRNSGQKGKFKEICEGVNLLPVLLTNVLPTPIPDEYNEPSKMKRRAATSEEYIEKYLHFIFEDNNLIERVKLVIISIGDRFKKYPAAKEKFDFSTELIKKYCKEKNILLQENIPFLARWDIKDEEFDLALTDTTRKKIKEIVNKFNASLK